MIIVNCDYKLAYSIDLPQGKGGNAFALLPFSYHTLLRMTALKTTRKKFLLSLGTLAALASTLPLWRSRNAPTSPASPPRTVRVQPEPRAIAARSTHGF